MYVHMHVMWFNDKNYGLSSLWLCLLFPVGVWATETPATVLCLCLLFPGCVWVTETPATGRLSCPSLIPCLHGVWATEKSGHRSLSLCLCMRDWNSGHQSLFVSVSHSLPAWGMSDRKVRPPFSVSLSLYEWLKLRPPVAFRLRLSFPAWMGYKRLKLRLPVALSLPLISSLWVWVTETPASRLSVAASHSPVSNDGKVSGAG